MSIKTKQRSNIITITMNTFNPYSVRAFETALDDTLNFRKQNILFNRFII